MKKIIPYLYLVCIAIGALVVMISNMIAGNNYKGNMWEASKELIEPQAFLQESEHMRQYVFDVSDLKEGENCLFFQTVHMTVAVYADEISEDTLIYEFSSNPSMFGKTSGAQYHFVDFPTASQKLIVRIDTLYKQFYKEQTLFYLTNGIWAFKDTIRRSLVEAFISCSFVILGMLLIGYWLVMGRKTDIQKKALYFGCFATFLGMWTLNETTLATLMHPNRVAASLTGFILLFLLLQPMVLFIQAYLQQEQKWIGYACCVIITLSMFICLGLHLTGVVEMRETAIVVHVLIGMVLLYMFCSFVVYSIKYGVDRKVTVNIVGVVILSLSAILDLGSFYADNMVNDMLGRFGMLTYIVILAVEVMTEFLKQMEENRKYTYYKELAVTDMLTGVRNRNAYERWEKEENDWRNMAIFTFDLNNLKKCNDTKGHLAGDKYIVEASDIIRSVFGKVGVCYRIGGDEFVVVIHKALRLNPDKYIRQLRKREQEYNRQDKEIQMQIACGYATCKSEEDTIERIRRRADSAMYKNKKELKQQERIAES